MFNLKRFGAAAMALMLCLTMIVGGAAAAPTTESDWQLDGTDAIADYAADGEVNETVIYDTEVNSDTLDDFDELTLEVTYGDDNTTVAEFDADDATVSGDSDDTTPLTLEWEVGHDDLEALPGDAGDATVADATITELESADGAAAVETADELEVTFSNEHAAAHVTDDSADVEELEASTFNSFSFGYLGQDESDLYTYDETVGIDGNNTTVTVVDDSDGVSEIDDALEDAESGDLITEVAVGDGDAPLAAFYGEADDDMVDADTDTYAVYHGDGVWTFNLGSDDYEGETEFSFTIESQSYTDADFDKADMGDLYLEQLEVSAFDTFGWTGAFSTFSVMDLLPF